nr:iron-sulfur cluster-binding domain-containing protein [Propionibacterium sp.]
LDLATPGVLAALVPDWRARASYVCGPEGLVADAERLWAGAPGLTVERFTLPRRVAPDTAGGRVTFARSGRRVDAPGARPLLEVAEGAGLTPASGCRMGICRTCLTRLDDGQVRDLGTGRVHGEPGDLVRLCVSAAAGDVRLDA